MLSIHLFRSLILLALMAIAPLASSATPDSTILGDWEVSRVLMTGGMQPQWSMHEDDPRLLGRRLSITAKGLQFRNADTGCVVQPMAGGRPQAMRSLFARPGSKRPSGMHGTLYGRLEDYELGALRERPVKLFAVRCPTGSEDFLGAANWLAATASPGTLLMPYQPDALLLLHRPGTPPDAGQTQYCRQADSPSDRAICADRQLRQMHGYTLSARHRAQSPRPELNAALTRDIAVQLEKRQACQGEPNCLYEVLDRHIELLVQRW